MGDITKEIVRLEKLLKWFETKEGGELYSK